MRRRAARATRSARRAAPGSLWMLMLPLLCAGCSDPGEEADSPTPADETTVPGDDDTTGETPTTSPGDDDSPAGDDDDSPAGDDDDSPAGDDDDGGSGDDDDTNPGERTLESCETSISASAPAFFRDLFRCVEIAVDGGSMTIHTVDLPPHRSYYYGQDDPNYEPFDYSRGQQYKPNPNHIEAQDIDVRIPLDPVPKGLVITGELVDGMAGTDPNEYKGAPGGIALNGVALFHGFAAPGDDIEQEKYTFDSYNGHPENTGTYHYHTWTPGPLEAVGYAGLTTSTTPGLAEVEIYGIMCDGTVILGCTEADGSTPDESDIDAQGGHVHDIVSPDGETWFSNRYHTHVCESIRHFTPEIQYYKECGVAPPPK